MRPAPDANRFPSGSSAFHRRPAFGPLALVLVATALGSSAALADWPTYLHDNARSGITADELPLPLTLQWVFRSPFPPEPAWGDPKPEPVEGYLELRRIHFDDTHQVIAGDGRVYFGTSADGKVYCLDGDTGQIRWNYWTGGPVRLAPALSDGKLYFGSDDGNAYCLDAQNGSLVWKFAAAPSNRRVLGHGRMISLWPLRSGVLV
ncbi:MAG: outer membrane protein assembly factor BamB family protein, partial [Thermoguttaceae bacterium]